MQNSHVRVYERRMHERRIHDILRPQGPDQSEYVRSAQLAIARARSNLLRLRRCLDQARKEIDEALAHLGSAQ